MGPNASALRSLSCLAVRYVVFYLMAMLAAVTPAPAYAKGTTVPPDILQAIAASPMSPSFGHGDIVVVEFYDYQCSYCKASQEAVEKLVETNPRVRLVLMDFPKLGDLSTEASLLTLAALRQDVDTYTLLHQMLMNKDVKLTEKFIFQTAASLGLDVNRMVADAEDPAMMDLLQSKINIGHQAGVSVTPSFIVGEHFYPGAADLTQLNKMVQAEIDAAY